MDFPLTLMNLAGSVALLLWGVRMVQTGIQRAFGARLRSFPWNRNAKPMEVASVLSRNNRRPICFAAKQYPPPA